MKQYTSIIDCIDLAAAIADSDNLVIIDCRFNLKGKSWGREAYAGGHIPGAIYADLDDDLSGEIIPGVTGRHPWLGAESIRGLFASWGVREDSQIVAYDQGHGGIAARLWAMARFIGIDTACVLNGGWQEWTRLELEVSTASATPAASDLLLAPSLLEVIPAERLSELTQLIDARAEIRYEGIEEPIDTIAGHIPGAINVPFLGNLTATLLWKSREEVAARFKRFEADESVGVYCGSGVTACHNLLAMEYSGVSVDTKLYAGSWSDYITDPIREVRLGARP